MDLSVIIPSYKDPFLHKTVRSILDHFVTDYEIIVVLDGYCLVKPLAADRRVRIIWHTRNLGMREAINSGVAAAAGDHLMRTDEHCMFCPEFDRIMLANAKGDEILTARRYFLDPYKWERMSRSPVDYERLIIQNMGSGRRKFSAQEWTSRGRRRKHLVRDETMAMQGSMWLMHRDWWHGVIHKLQTEGYGPMYQDSVEMVFKTWRAGGRLMVNKRAWYAHKHRQFKRTHHYAPSRAGPEWEYAISVWHEDFLEQKARWSNLPEDRPKRVSRDTPSN